MIYFLIAFLIILDVIIVIFAKKKSYKNHQKRSAQIGEEGERIIGQILERFGVVFNNYILTDNLKKSHQIDHILVCEKGVFAVETKNYSGMIFGEEEQLEWAQILGHGVINKFYNPIKQNATHIFHLGKILPKNTTIFSCVAFVKADISHIKADCVFSPNSLVKYIKDQQKIYDSSQVSEICAALSSHRNTEITAEEHIESILQTQVDIANGICPRCGGKLVIRKSEYGEFMGCENYPKCKFTKKP